MPSTDENKQRLQLKNLSTASMILGIVSLFIGGVPLSIVGLVIALVAYSKYTKLVLAGANESDPFLRIIKRSLVRNICLCAIALVLNAITLYLMWPTIMYVIQTGDYMSYFGLSSVDTGSSSSFWG